jgi:bifunctional UDP-N-acetylglucosamine pyrophosphorylase/glucosamine-1-phosphate N-acetyltransferase
MSTNQLPLNIIILAAGQGKRMRSQLPKILHSFAGKPILKHIIDTAQQCNAKNIFVVDGHGGAQIRDQLKSENVSWVTQEKQLGTGHAAAQTLPHLDEENRVLILLGDAPLIRAQTLQKLLTQTPQHSLGLVTVEMPNPFGLGRILRDEKNQIIGITEEKDATETQRKIKETNTGIFLANAKDLHRWLPQLQNNNAQGEYYLTDIIALAAKEKIAITTVNAESPEEVQGINDRDQLVTLERYHQQQIAKKFLLAGVTIIDPLRFDLRGELTAAEDVTIDINVILEGKVSIGKNSVIGANSILRNVTIGENVVIKPNCVIEDAHISNDCVIGPFARIRPGTELANEVHIGNFVEIKKSKVDTGSKINHLTYVGDAIIGKKVNIGAGTITCNYDGVNKHETVIGDGAFIGSGTELVAPVSIGENATIGAGSVITHEAPSDALTLRRAKQVTFTNWKRPK